MNRQTADKFRWMAQCLGEVCGMNSGNWSGYTAGGEGLMTKLMSKDTVRFYRHGKEDTAFIEISNLSPTKISNTVYHKPITLNKSLSDAYVSTASNASTAEVTRTYEIDEGVSTSTSIDLGASVTLGISESIAAGGDLYGFTSTTEISASIEASFNYNTSSGSDTERSITTEITIPPMTKTTVTATKSTSELKQDIDYTAEVEFSMYFLNTGTLGLHIDSYSDLQKFRAGEYYPGLFKDWDNVTRASLDNVVDKIFRSGGGTLANDNNFPVINTEYTQTLEFSNAVTGDVVVTSEEIK